MPGFRCLKARMVCISRFKLLRLRISSVLFREMRDYIQPE
jgi:hypothetical protein